MSIIEAHFRSLAAINFETALTNAFTMSQELLKKKGIEDRDSLKNKLIEYAVQQGGNEQSLSKFSTQDKFLTFMRRMLIEMPNVSAPVEEKKTTTPNKPEQEKRTTKPSKAEEDYEYEAVQILYNELNLFLPEEPISYGEWIANHGGIVNDIVTKTVADLAQQINPKEAERIVSTAYWKIINHDEMMG